MCRRAAGDGSSPSSPTILPKWKKTRLWQQLRKLDRKCGKLLYYLQMSTYGLPPGKMNCKPQNYYKWKKDFEKYDEKRKEVRNKLKGY